MHACAACAMEPDQVCVRVCVALCACACVRACVAGGAPRHPPGSRSGENKINFEPCETLSVEMMAIFNRMRLRTERKSMIDISFRCRRFFGRLLAPSRRDAWELMTKPRPLAVIRNRRLNSVALLDPLRSVQFSSVLLACPCQSSAAPLETPPSVTSKERRCLRSPRAHWEPKL